LSLIQLDLFFFFIYVTGPSQICSLLFLFFLCFFVRSKVLKNDLLPLSYCHMQCHLNFFSFLCSPLPLYFHANLQFDLDTFGESGRGHTSFAIQIVIYIINITNRRINTPCHIPKMNPGIRWDIIKTHISGFRTTTGPTVGCSTRNDISARDCPG
jgi:hypothetical protein